MIDEAIKKYKIPKKRIPQVKELYNITGDSRLSTYIVKSTKHEPELVDFLIETYKERSRKSKFRNPCAIINTMFKTLKVDFVIHKKQRGTELPQEQFEYFMKSGAVKIITLTNAIGDNLIFEVVKDTHGNVTIIYKDTIPPYK